MTADDDLDESHSEYECDDGDRVSVLDYEWSLSFNIFVIFPLSNINIYCLIAFVLFLNFLQPPLSRPSSSMSGLLLNSSPPTLEQHECVRTPPLRQHESAPNLSSPQKLVYEEKLRHEVGYNITEWGTHYHVRKLFSLNYLITVINIDLSWITIFLCFSVFCSQRNPQPHR